MSVYKVHLENLISFGEIGYRMYLLRRDGPASGHFAFMRPPTLHTVDEVTAASPDDAFIDDSRAAGQETRAFLQAAADAAWEIGIKPRQLEDSRNELAAVRYHLEDMRRLVIK